MKVKTIHIGPIEPDRQYCIDQQKKIYGEDHELIRSFPADFNFKTFSDIREPKDYLFTEYLVDGFFAMDSDVIPLEKWIPEKDGLWLPHSWGRLENYMCVAIGEDALEYAQNMMLYFLSESPGFNWMLEYFAMYPGPFELIPCGPFKHLGLTYTKQSLTKG